jgi:hypothetical protein
MEVLMTHNHACTHAHTHAHTHTKETFLLNGDKFISGQYHKKTWSCGCIHLNQQADLFVSFNTYLKTWQMLKAEEISAWLQETTRFIIWSFILTCLFFDLGDLAYCTSAIPSFYIPLWSLHVSHFLGTTGWPYENKIK